MIIPARDRCSKLALYLQSVKSIRIERPWELIIVDNGFMDGAGPNTLVCRIVNLAFDEIRQTFPTVGVVLCRVAFG